MPSLQDYERDYWAPDRDEVLTNYRKYGTDDRSRWTDAPAPAPAAPGPSPDVQGSPSGPPAPSPAPAPQPQQTLLQRYQTDYHAPDRDVVLRNIQQYGTDDRSKWVTQQAPAQPTTKPFDRTTFRDTWMAMPEDRAVQDAFLRSYGLTPDAAGRVTLPTGEIIDLRYGAKAGGLRPTWTGAGGTQNGVPVPTGGGAPAGGGAAPTNPGIASTGGGAPRGGTGDPEIDKAFREQLLRLMQSGGRPIDLNDPGIATPYGAAKLASDRELEQGRKELAEMLYAQGGGNLEEGRMAQGMQQGRERAAAGLAGIQGDLVLSEIDARRQDTREALGLANAIGARREAQELTKSLADLDNQFRYAQLQQQGSQFDRSLDQSDRQFDRSMGQRESEFGRTFGEGRRQFNERMDYDWDSLEAMLNRQSYLDMLGR